MKKDIEVNKIDDKTKNKKNLFIVLGLVLLIGIGLAIAYFSASAVSGTKTVQTGNLSITYTNESVLRLTNIIPLYEDEIEDQASQISFRITNNGSRTAYANINLTNVSISNNLKISDFKYKLYNSDTNEQIATGDFSNATSEMSLINNIPFAAGAYVNYKLYIYIEETDTDQSSVSGGTFSGTVTVKATSTDIYEDPSGANSPKLVQGMVPVVYNESSDVWQVADTSKKWYAYNEQMWANAVTVNNATYRTAAAGTQIPMSAVDTMWVWIPRYKYKITSNIGSTSNVTNPPQIDVVFESGTETTGTALSSCGIDATNCYYTHPAFRDGTTQQLVTSTQAADGTYTGWDRELSGIWVGKFETGGTASKPLVKPDIVSLMNQNINTKFQTSLKFVGGTMNTSTGEVSYSTNQYGLTRNSTTDSHMAKNIEWGAVVYLSQSKYGKNGNSNYTGTNKEIYINNSSNYYTGRSYGATNPSNVSTQYGTYGYNDKSCSTTSSNVCTGSKTANTGTGASTTGTIYGIYDMYGGAWDYTMSNWSGYSGSTSSYNSGFSGPNYDGSTTSGVSFPEAKYYDKYMTGTSNYDVTSDKSIKGDATYETEMWYADGGRFIYPYQPWAIHGAAYGSGSSSGGIFCFNGSYGSSGNGFGFRSVLIP